MQTKETRTFEKGLDLDSSPLTIQPGYYRDALNIYNGGDQKGRNNVITPERGNILIDDTLPEGENTCISTCEDIENDAIIRFTYNSLGNHSIRRYISGAAAGEVIIEDPILNFQLDNPVRADVVGGLLYWTDGFFISYLEDEGIPGFNPPRKVNIEKAMSGGYDGLDQQVLDRIKYPPHQPPTAVYDTDETQVSNFLYRFLFQFRYRYIYDDFERSVWSPISSTPIPSNIESQSGRSTRASFYDNVIDVSLDSGHKTVTRIEVASRVGNSRPFGVFKVIDKEKEGIDDNTVITVRFNNNQSGRALSSEENGKNYDRVPQVSKDQELVEGNRLVDANIIEGYDTPNLETSNATFISDKVVIPPSVDLTILISVDLGTGEVLYRIPMPPATSMQIGGEIIVIFNGIEYIFTALQTYDSEEELSEDLASFLVGEGLAAESEIFGGIWRTTVTFPSALASSSASYTVSSPFVREKTWKAGTYHPFGIVYTDRAGRPASVATNDNMNVYVPFWPEYKGGDDYDDEAFLAKIRLELSDTPPEWATDYHVVARRDTRLISFAQYRVSGSALVDNRLELTLGNSYTDNNLGAFIQHEILVGDVVRFITTGDETFADEYKELSVVAYDASTNVVTVDFGETLPNLMENMTADDFLMEIYTPRKFVDESNDIWYEIGVTGRILNPHTPERTHDRAPAAESGAVLGSTLTQILAGGDVWLRTRDTNLRTYWLEDRHFTDYRDSPWSDFGRVHTLDPFARRQELKTGLRYSEVFSQNTRVNGLSTVDDENFESVQDVHGEIQRIMEVGFVLKVLQDQKLTSIYLSRSVLFNTDGSSNISSSTAVLGTKNASDTEFGTIHPNSVVRHGRHMYFVDTMTGAVVRDASNGPQDISKLGMNTFFSDLLETYRNLPQSDIVSGFDKDNERLFITFRYFGDIRPEPLSTTISFFEPENKWVSFHSWVPEMLGRRGDRFYAFKDGEMYLQDAGPIGEYFGELAPSRISLIFNQDPTQVKTYHTISQETSEAWGSPEDTDVITLEAQHNQGDNTRVKSGRYKRIEGGYYAGIPFALNTDVPDPVVNGRPMKGRALQVVLRNEAEGEVYLLGVTVGYSKSERSGVDR